MTDEQKIDILKLVYTEEGQNLRFETSTAQNLVRYFVTVELALAAWLTTSGAVTQPLSQGVLFGLNLLFGVCVGVLIWRNYQRRDEVVSPLRNALHALKLDAPDAYLPGSSIHTWEVNASWRNGYLFLIGLFCVAEALPIFFLSKGAGS